jgi:hypothetical protein
MADPIPELSTLRDELKSRFRDCAEGLLKKSELQTLNASVTSAVRGLFEKGSRLDRIAERSAQELGAYWVEDWGTDFAPQRDCDRIAKWISVTDKLLAELHAPGPASAAIDEIVLAPDDRYTAWRHVLAIMKTASKRLTIIDPYLDDSVFDYLDLVDVEIELQLLGGQNNKTAGFSALFRQFRTKRPSAKASISNGAFHDRFIIIDDSIIWHMGTSLNSIGKSASMLNRITDQAQRAKLMELFANTWSAASLIT